MNDRTKAALAAALLCAVAATCSASHISLQISAASTFKRGAVSVDVTVTNRGDEAAMSVWVQAAVGGASARGGTRHTLAPNEGFQSTLDMGPAPTPPGAHTVVIKVHYTDPNGHPFSALTSIPLVTSADPAIAEEAVSAKLSTVSLRDRGSVYLTLSPEGVPPDDIRVRLVLPDELACPSPSRVLRLASTGREVVEFELSNVSAQPGSTYPVFAVVDYALAGVHHSRAAQGRVSIDAQPGWHRKAWLVPIAILLLVFIAAQLRGGPPRNAAGPSATAWAFAVMVVAALLAYILYHLSPRDLLSDTLTTGGDVPAHSYLASHLKQQLFGHGRISSWAGGWWCGFPMFQFYFSMPYVAIALLSVIIPFNVAFKLVSVAGMLMLPPAAHASARSMRLPAPVPLLMAVAMVLYLFDATHVMWGVNIYSTLAGMIANSIGFPIMLVFIGAAYRDMNAGSFRVSTVLLLVALLASHFFTSVIALLTVAVVPFLRPRGGFFKAARTGAAEIALALLLMAWWIVPLVAKSGYAMDAGLNWNIRILEWAPGRLPPVKTLLPPFAVAGLPLAVVGVVLGARRRLAPVFLLLWMLVASLLLFHFGTLLAPVFVNARLWPFVLFAALALEVIGLGLLLENRPGRELAVLAALVGALVFGTGHAGVARNWAKWNYGGLETKRHWPVFRDLVLPLRGTPGRLANDLHVHNSALGSTRVFECVPHVIGKPILEGGLVNSALGSMFSYYVQSETSKDCAGFPNIVQPASFDMDRATAHLRLFNVKHFIARWRRTKRALRDSDDWRLLASSDAWELHELQTHEGRYVFIPERHPLAVRTADWKQAGMDWIYAFESLDQPFVLLPDDPDATAAPSARRVSEAAFRAHLAARRRGEPGEPSAPTAAAPDAISHEEITDRSIRFTTSAVGLPHIVKCSYYPNWKVRGASAVHMVTPAFMLVYPEQQDVELYYGSTAADVAGRCLAAVAALATCILAAVKRSRPGHAGTGVSTVRTGWLKFLDATFGSCACRVIGYLQYLAGSCTCASGPVKTEGIRRVLVIRPGGMGDMILLLPTIRRLQAELPAAAIDIVCERRNREVLGMAGLSAKAMPYDRYPWLLLWRLLTRRYDLAVDSEQFHHLSAVMAFASGAPVRIGFKINPCRNLLYTHFISYSLEGYEGQEFMRLLEPLGIADTQCNVEGCLSDLPPVPSKAGTTTLRELLGHAPCIAVAAGSTTPYKSWGALRFARLVDMLLRDLDGAVILVGGPGDRAISEAVFRHCSRPPRLLSLAGSLSLAETAAVIRRCSLFIGLDSGLAHVATAVGTDTVVLFGPSDCRKWGSPGETHQVVDKGMQCAPCFIFGYHRLCRAMACMEAINVEDVYSCAAAALGRTTTASNEDRADAQPVS